MAGGLKRSLCSFDLGNGRGAMGHAAISDLPITILFSSGGIKIFMANRTPENGIPYTVYRFSAHQRFTLLLSTLVRPKEALFHSLLFVSRYFAVFKKVKHFELSNFWLLNKWRWYEESKKLHFPSTSSIISTCATFFKRNESETFQN